MKVKEPVINHQYGHCLLFNHKIKSLNPNATLVHSIFAGKLIYGNNVGGFHNGGKSSRENNTKQPIP